MHIIIIIATHSIWSFAFHIPNVLPMVTLQTGVLPSVSVLHILGVLLANPLRGYLPRLPLGVGTPHPSVPPMGSQ